MENHRQSLLNRWFINRADYCQRKRSFISELLPERAVRLPFNETAEILSCRLGEAFELALSPELTKLDDPHDDLPSAVRSPVWNQPDGSWLRRTKMVGVNIRTIGGFWELVAYALTLPGIQSSIHLLPVWQPGVVSSLYGIVSWEINPEFFSRELAAHYPWLNTPARQLRAVINLLHAMGKTVGMDVIPHTDRFSETALAFPEYFEWLQRRETEILDHRPELVEVVQKKIYHYLQRHGPATPGDDLPSGPDELFSNQVDEATRLRWLFGLPGDYQGRLSHRINLIHELYQSGYETVPVTMAPPFRGLEVDPSPQAVVIDENGLAWRDYRFVAPQAMSRVFNPLARYQFYENLSTGDGWQIDFDRPRRAVWGYFCAKYAAMQRSFGFDFMRGDMSHVQMRPGGVPADLDTFYDPLGSVKACVRSENNAPYFGYFAESFLAPRDVMGYGEEIDHLEASQADVTLGDLQSTSLDSAVFRQRLRYYGDLLSTRHTAPCFTVITSDKDDPRFDSFYLEGCAARLFLSFFLADMPGYMALGFESRDPHPVPAPHEHYTKLYVFQEKKGEKATHGPYTWGSNRELFDAINRIRLAAEQIWPVVGGKTTRWLISPDATGENPILAWTQEGDQPTHLFVVNTSGKAIGPFGLPAPVQPSNKSGQIECIFSTHGEPSGAALRPAFNGFHYRIEQCYPGEGRIYVIGQQRLD